MEFQGELEQKRFRGGLLVNEYKQFRKPIGKRIKRLLTIPSWLPLASGQNTPSLPTWPPALVLRVSLYQPLCPLHPPPVTRRGQGTGDHWNACASDTAWVLLCSVSRTSFPTWPPGCHFLQFSSRLKVNSIVEPLAGPHPSPGSLGAISQGPWSLVYHNRGIYQTVADLFVSPLLCEPLDGRN